MLTEVTTPSASVGAEKSGQCYHCGLDIPENLTISAQIDARDFFFCCPACKTVFELITAGGLTGYYEFRSEFANTPAKTREDFSVFDNPGFQRSFCRKLADDESQALLYLDGIHCAACVWLIEKALQKLPGVVSVDVSLIDNAADLHWDETKIRLSQIVDHLQQLGYRAAPWQADTQRDLQTQAESSLLRRVGLAGIVMMQVGMFSIALYVSGETGMATEHKDLLHAFSALLSTPVLLYSAQGFFLGAWRSLKQLRVNMDVPVALALAIAWTASMFTVIRGSGEVYFDSICMFVFLLTGVRYLELRARNKFTSLHNQGALPATCKCFTDSDAGYTHVSLHDLRPGQIIYVHQGEIIPVDGRLLDASATLNEASINGEFLPVEKQRGEQILSGTINLSPGLKLQVEKPASDSCLQNLQRLALQARNKQPTFLQFSDRVARYFSCSVLLLTLVASAIWYAHDASRVMAIAISMLVISCPCALSLAAPAAFTVAINSLRKQGILVCDCLVFEKLQKLVLVVFDKTGTLTKGKFFIHKAHYFSDALPAETDMLAQALEQWSEHPIAEAFRVQHPTATLPALDNIELINSNGVQAQFKGKTLRIGSVDFCSALAKEPAPEVKITSASTCIWLANSDSWLACYELQDALRDDAVDTVAALGAMHHHTAILSGDNETVVADAAQKLGVSRFYAACSPQGKLDVLQRLQQDENKIVLMVGDGVNDLPVLAQADISVAMNSANQLAQVQADCVLLGNQLQGLILLLRKARATWRVVKQNIGWALLYNFTALPLAALGFVPPWVAALGMSASSLIVILNAAKLNRIHSGKA